MLCCPAALRTLTDVSDLREEHVEDPEQQQRPDQLPEIAEGRAEEPQLPFGSRDVEGQVPEPRPVVGRAPAGRGSAGRATS